MKQSAQKEAIMVNMHRRTADPSNYNQVDTKLRGDNNNKNRRRGDYGD